MAIPASYRADETKLPSNGKYLPVSRYAEEVSEEPAEGDGLDGRRARGARTRLRVLEALLALVEEGELRPTAQEIATRAGVALRTVYHHFEDVEALRRMALDLQMSRHHEILQGIDLTLPLPDRVGIVTRQLRQLFEAITPIRRATLFDEHSSPEMAEGLRRSRSIRRAYLEQAFAPELGTMGGDKRLVLDAIDVATSWQTWHSLRGGLGRSAAATERVVHLSLEELLSSSAVSRAR